MKDIAIVCDVMKDEFERLKKEGRNGIDYIFVEQYLHNTPDRMRERLQQEIDRVGNEYNNIVLIYGLCSNGVVGLRSDKHKIIIPRIDDCISIFLGSR